ncbi:MAG: amino acid-binding protein [bacterium]
MTLKQLSVFLENKPGRLGHPCKALAAAGINIPTLCLADTGKSGILRIMVREWEKAKGVLEKAGCVVNVSDVLAIEIPDRPGGMESILAILEPNAITVEYMYAFTLKRGSNAVMIVRVDKPDQASKALHKNGLSILDAAAFFTLA